MRKIPYTYCLVKYVHNPAAGEMLNVGVLICAPAAAYVDARFNQYYERLSHTFANFDGDHYREIVCNIESAILKLKNRNPSPTLFLIADELSNVEQLAKQIMPDRGLSIQFGGMLAGLTDDPERELWHIFDEAVVSQYPHKEKKGRDDEDVWSLYKKPLSEKRLDKVLQTKHFVSESYDYKFDHAFKNEKWHVLRPVTMDYAHSQTIQDRATRLLGETSALDGDRELGMYYILLGEPKQKSHKTAYIKAKNLLNRIPLRKQIIEENEAKDFAQYLADYMEKHGVLRTQNK